MSETSAVLNGWKEISHYLGKSVRSVQRWERELGLPVRRLDTGLGQSVYAKVAELDQWREQRGAAGVPEDDPDDGVLVVPGGNPGPTEAPAIRKLDLVFGGALLAVGFLLGLISASRDVAHAGAPVRFAHVGSQFRAYAAGGEVSWQHDFGTSVSSLSSSPAVHVDLDGDGRLEVLTSVRFGPAGSRVGTRSDAVAAFNEDGTLRWQVSLDLSLRFGHAVFEGPWQVQAFTVQESGPARRVWIAFGHHTWWPGVVVEVAPHGEHRVVFVQSGRVRSVAEWVTPKGHYLALGGVNNEYRRSSLAVIPVHPQGDPPFVYASPQTAGGDFACDSCADSQPLRYFLFPESEFQAPMKSLSATVEYVTPTGQDLKVSIDGPGGFTIVTMAPDLRVRAMHRADNFQIQHRMFEAQGLVRHPLEACLDGSGAQPVRVFSAGVWSELRVPVAMDGRRADADRP